MAAIGNDRKKFVKTPELLFFTFIVSIEGEFENHSSKK